MAAIRMGDYAAALPDLERVVSEDTQYDFHGAAGLLAHVYANTGQPERAEKLFQEVTKISTSSETYYNYACFLASRRAPGRGPGMGGTPPRQAPQYARLPAPPRASLVPESERVVEPIAGVKI